MGILDFVLGILEFALGILNFSLEILEFPVTPSPSGGSLYGILEFLVYKRKKPLGNSRLFVMRSPDQSQGMTQGLGILEFVLEILVFAL